MKRHLKAAENRCASTRKLANTYQFQNFKEKIDPQSIFRSLLVIPEVMTDMRKTRAKLLHVHVNNQIN